MSEVASCPAPDGVVWTSGMDYTETMGKISCVAWLYPFHIVSAYIVVLTGLLAMITRLTERFKWTHVWWGRIFMLGYYYASWTSILIYKQGLPRAIVVFMTIMFNALALGWLAIKFHSGGNMEEQGRDWKQRLFSLKALHGVCMFIAWYQMAGRAFVTNPFHEYQCDTIPVYKNDPNRMPIQQDDPDMYGGTPNSVFISRVVVTCAVMAAVGSVGGSCWFAWRDRKQVRPETVYLLHNGNGLSYVASAGGAAAVAQEGNGQILK
eukprot:g41516.t1